jgi:hypothetical protein
MQSYSQSQIPKHKTMQGTDAHFGKALKYHLTKTFTESTCVLVGECPLLILEGNNRTVIFASQGLLLLRSSCPSQPYHNCHFLQLPTIDAKHFCHCIINEWFCTNDTSEDALFQASLF